MLRRCVAEFVGTFALVFIGCGARIFIGDVSDPAGILVVHMAFALTIAAMIYTVSHISAGIFNPALTLGFAIAKRFPWPYVLPYWLAQCAGAIIASTVHWLLFPEKASIVHYGATLPKVNIPTALIIEGILTFFLMLVNMAAATDTRFKRADSGLTVGFTILVAGLFANSLTGASMNPARSLGPALFAGDVALTSFWLYCVGPAIGVVVAVGAYELMRGSKEHTKNVLDEPPDEEKKETSPQTPQMSKNVHA
jgi:MIP family channel proteins